MSTYIITDGNGTYIYKNTQGYYVATTQSRLASIFKDYTKAENVYRNLDKNLRKRYMIKCTSYNPSLTENATIEEQKSKPRHYKITDIKESETENIMAIKKYIESINNIIQEIEHKKEDMKEELSNFDKQVSDIHHYIEFGKFNAYEGWKAFSMLQAVLRGRRMVKDEINILQEIGKSKCCTDSLRSIEKTIGELDTRIYKPRVLTELFEV